MSDFAISWALSRKRFVDEITGLNQAQLNWRLQPNSLSIGEMAIHLAGVEIFFASQLTGAQLDDNLRLIARTATEGVVDDTPFPFSKDQITPSLVAETLELSRDVMEPVITEATEDIREKVIKSALGPMISGEGAFARMGFHSAYHQGQAYLLKNAPGFPAS